MNSKEASRHARRWNILINDKYKVAAHLKDGGIFTVTEVTTDHNANLLYHLAFHGITKVSEIKKITIEFPNLGVEDDL